MARIQLQMGSTTRAQSHARAMRGRCIGAWVKRALAKWGRAGQRRLFLALLEDNAIDNGITLVIGFQNNFSVIGASGQKLRIRAHFFGHLGRRIERTDCADNQHGAARRDR